MGIKVGRQNYTYDAAGLVYNGENVYGILQAPRGDATEAIVLVAAWSSIRGLVNRHGVALALTLTRYFKRKLSLPVSQQFRSGRVMTHSPIGTDIFFRLVPLV